MTKHHWEQNESEDDSAREIMENKVQKKVAEGNRARSSHKASCQLFKHTHSGLLSSEKSYDKF